MRRFSALVAVVALATAAACTSREAPPLADPASWCELVEMEGTPTDPQLVDFVEEAPDEVADAAETVALAVAIDRLGDEPETLPEDRPSIADLFDLPEGEDELQALTPTEEEVDAASEEIGAYVSTSCN